MAKFKTVEQSYADWWDKVKPDGASQVQVEACRKSFYSGAWLMLTHLLGIGEDSVSESAGVFQLVAYRLELERFFEKLAGEAK